MRHWMKVKQDSTTERKDMGAIRALIIIQVSLKVSPVDGPWKCVQSPAIKCHYFLFSDETNEATCFSHGVFVLSNTQSLVLALLGKENTC